MGRPGEQGWWKVGSDDEEQSWIVRQVRHGPIGPSKLILTGPFLSRCWSWVAMALVGEELEEDSDEICGAVVSLRSKVDRIQVGFVVVGINRTR